MQTENSNETEEWAMNVSTFFNQKLLLTGTATSKNKRDIHQMEMKQVVERRKEYMRDGFVYDQTIHKWVKKTEFDQSHELGWQDWLANEWRKKNKAGIPKLGDLLNIGEFI